MLEPTTFTSECDPADYYPYPAGTDGIPPD